MKTKVKVERKDAPIKVRGIVIPQAAIDAGRAAMGDKFILEDVRGAVGGVLREIHYQSLQEEWSYGPNVKDEFDKLLATKLIQQERALGRIRYTPAGWVRQGCPQH